MMKFIFMDQILNHASDRNNQDIEIESLDQISLDELTRNDLSIWILGNLIAMFTFFAEILHFQLKT